MTSPRSHHEHRLRQRVERRGHGSCDTRPRPPAARQRYCIESADAATHKDFISSEVDRQRRILSQMLCVPDLDIRQHPWDKAAKAAREPLWSEIYLSISQGSSDSLAIAATDPV